MSKEIENSKELMKNIIENPKIGKKNIYLLINFMQSDDIEIRLNATWSLCYTVANYPETLEKVLIGILGHINNDNCKYEVSYIIDYLKNNYPNKTEELFSELIRRKKIERVEGKDNKETNIIVQNPSEDLSQEDLQQKAEEKENTGTSNTKKKKSVDKREETTDRTTIDKKSDYFEKINKNIKRFKNINIIEFLYSDPYSNVYKAIAEKENIMLLLRVFKLEDFISDSFSKDLLEKLQDWENISEHENVVDLHDWGEYPEPWIITDYYDNNIGSQIAKNLGRAFKNSISIAKAISYAHKNNVLHMGLDIRDIVFLEDLFDMKKMPKVNNFGLIKVYIENSDDKFDFRSIIDPRYAAPEYFNTKKYGEIDQYTDIYNLGAVLYKILTGFTPFEKSDKKNYTIGQNESDLPSNINDSIPSQVDDIIRKATAEEKLSRYEDVDYLVRDLEEII